MVLFILWTGTLLHDIGEMYETSSQCSSSIEKQAFIHLIAGTAEFQAVDLEEHFHDAVVALRNFKDIVLRLPVSKPNSVFACPSFESESEFKIPQQRPPPLVSSGLPTRTFMTKRALLI